MEAWLLFSIAWRLFPTLRCMVRLAFHSHPSAHLALLDADSCTVIVRACIRAWMRAPPLVCFPRWFSKTLPSSRSHPSRFPSFGRSLRGFFRRFDGSYGFFFRHLPSLLALSTSACVLRLGHESDVCLPPAPFFLVLPVVRLFRHRHVVVFVRHVRQSAFFWRQMAAERRQLAVCGHRIHQARIPKRMRGAKGREEAPIGRVRLLGSRQAMQAKPHARFQLRLGRRRHRHEDARAGQRGEREETRRVVARTRFERAREGPQARAKERLGGWKARPRRTRRQPRRAARCSAARKAASTCRSRWNVARSSTKIARSKDCARKWPGSQDLPRTSASKARRTTRCWRRSNRASCVPKRPCVAPCTGSTVLTSEAVATTCCTSCSSRSDSSCCSGSSPS
mmetsp:Transcript_7895/g.48807  ORF Transcript_7895/g.48807 Transcript_7895/m.48807 type:complete len:394 (+) Transcript_7895:607-1788(+)